MIRELVSYDIGARSFKILLSPWQQKQHDGIFLLTSRARLQSQHRLTREAFSV
jgi:hypothetical protein